MKIWIFLEFQDEIVFQQDGTTMQFYRWVRDYFVKQYPNGLIGRRSSIECTVGSPDMTSFEYFHGVVFMVHNSWDNLIIETINSGTI